MTNTAKIIMVLIATALIIGGGYYAFKKRATDEAAKQTAQEVTINPVNGITVGEKVPETNPFKTNVNPYDSYKNPFN